jgi:hypothetical protein
VRKVLLLMGLSMLGAMLFSSVALAQQTSASASASPSASASAGSAAVSIGAASSVAPSASATASASASATASATASASVLSETGGPPFATALALAALLALVGSGLVASRLLAHRGGS